MSPGFLAFKLSPKTQWKVRKACWAISPPPRWTSSKAFLWAWGNLILGGPLSILSGLLRWSMWRRRGIALPSPQSLPNSPIMHLSNVLHRATHSSLDTTCVSSVLLPLRYKKKVMSSLCGLIVGSSSPGSGMRVLFYLVGDIVVAYKPSPGGHPTYFLKRVAVFVPITSKFFFYSSSERFRLRICQ